MLNLWLLAIWRCLLIFHQNRTTNTLRVPRKERITSHRLIDFHVAKCTLGSFSNAHLSREKPTSEMVFEVVFQPPHGTMASKSFNIDTNSPCSLFPFTVGPVGDLLTTWPAGVSWCAYPYEDHQLFKIWWLLRIHVRGGTVTYHLNVPSPPILLVQPLRSRTFHHLFVTQLWSALVLARKDQDV